MAVALYRKYRPKTFGEMVGQEHVTEPLSQALRTGRLNHAYLFSGPRGCGKTSSARILARSLNCAQGPTPEPCGVCESCVALGPDGAGSIDVVEIDAASHGGVDDARDLRERAFYTPVSGRFKIYIIDEAHMVSSAGFNALLKLVEEPPEYVKFVFATTEPEKVLPTIKSRTHHYPFRLFPPAVVRPYLEQLCQAEQITVEPAVFPLVVRAGGGSMRDTLSVLDQLIAGAGPDGVGYARAVALLGVTDAALLDDICDALAAGDGAAVFAAIDRVADAGHDPRRFAADLLERFRDLIVLQQVPDAVGKGLLDAPDDQLARMSTHAAQLGPAALSRYAEIVHNGLVEMRGTTSPRLLLELVCARMLLPAADDGSAALLHRLERMERRLGAAGDPATAPPPTPAPPPVPSAPPPAPAPPVASAPPAPPPVASAPPASSAPPPVASAPPASSAPPPVASAPPASSVPPAPPGAPAPTAAPGAPAPPAAPGAPGAIPEPSPATGGAIDAVAMRRVWDEVVATVGRRSKRSAAVVREATVRDVEDGNTIVLQFQHGVHATMLSSNPKPVLDAVHDVLGGAWQLRCESGEAPRISPPVPGGPPPPEPAPAASDWPEPARPGGAADPPGPPAPAAGAPPPEPAAGPELDDQVDLETDERTTVGNSEQQAMKLLQETLGAEKIGEVAP